MDKKFGQKRLGQRFIPLTQGAWGVWCVIRSTKCQSPNTSNNTSSCYIHPGTGLHPKFRLLYAYINPNGAYSV